MQKEGGQRQRPRSFVGGGSFEFAYDRRSGGIRDTGTSEENIESKPRRPLSLYESLSKDFSTSRQNSTSPTRPDDNKLFASSSGGEKADDMNKEKVRRNSEKGEDGLRSRKFSDSAETRALYVELSSPPTKSVDEKFNAVSRLRSLFDHGNAAPVVPRSSSANKTTLPGSVLGQNGRHGGSLVDVSKERKHELETKRPKFEKIEAEKKKKLFAPPAPVKLDDLLKRESPRSSEEKIPKFRRSYPLEHGQNKDKVDTKERAFHVTHSPPPTDEFEEMHRRRRSLPKKRSSSFEFEGLEDNVEVIGENKIDINMILGLETTKEDPVAESKEEESETPKDDTQRTDGDIESLSLGEIRCDAVVEPLDQQISERSIDNSAQTNRKATTIVDDNDCEQDALADKTEHFDVDAPRDRNKETIVEEICSKEQVSSEEKPFSVDQELQINGNDSLAVDEDIIMAQEECDAEAGLDFNALDNLTDSYDQSDYVMPGYDSFDSFALNVRSKKDNIDAKISENANEDVKIGENVVVCTVDEQMQDDFNENVEEVADQSIVDFDIKDDTDSSLVADEDEIVHAENIEEKEVSHTVSSDSEQDFEDADEEMKPNKEESVPVSQMSIIASVSGLTKDDDVEEKLEDSITEALDNSTPNTVELDDEYYDSDTGVDDDSAVEGDSQLLYSSVNETPEELEESIEENEQEEHEEDGAEDDHEYDEEDESTVVEAEDPLMLPPAPSHSCLSSGKGADKKKRKVYFNNDKGSIIYTYSAEEYNRSNREIDALTASAEWELEKRVEEKDMFTVDLDKRDGGLGLSIIGLGVGTDSGVEKLGIFVKSLTPNGAAYKDRRIQVQDQILEVNGISLVGVTQDFAAHTLRNTSGKVRFLMGRDKTKRHYQAPATGADPTLQDLERKHNVELEEIHVKIRKAEHRAAIAEHNLEEVRQSLLEEEERRQILEEELEKARNEIDYMKEKHEKKSSEKIDTLEKSLSKLTTQLSFSEENLDKVQRESDNKIEELQIALAEKENDFENLQNENSELVSLQRQNAEKLSELEECLATANKDQEGRIEEIQELKERCKLLEMEVENSRDAKMLLEDIEKKKEVADSSSVVEESYAAEVMVANSHAEKLQKELDRLSEEIELRNQFASIIVAERDTLKELVGSLEESCESQNENFEKREIEYAVKMMSYENKIKDLEQTINSLKGLQQEKPKRKLFPEIEQEVVVERTVEVQSEAVAESAYGVNDVAMMDETSTEIRKPYVLPPRDYEVDHTAEAEKHTAVVTASVESVTEGRSRKDSDSSSSCSSSSEKDEQETIHTKEAEEDKEAEKIEIEETVLAVAKGGSEVPEVDKEAEGIDSEETVPIDDAEKQMDAPVPIVVKDVSEPNNTDISGGLDDGVNEIKSIVNPVQKPPRTYSDVAQVGQDIHLRSYSLNGKLQETVVPEHEKVDEFIDVSKNIKVKRSSNYNVIIQSSLVEEFEQKPFDEEILKDLPESSVDSDSEILGGTNQGEGGAGSKPNMEGTASDQPTVVAAVDTEVVRSENIDNADTRATEGVPSQINEDVQSVAEQDRSSFLEAFSKNPAFGSWFNGEFTIIEQEKKDEQADEIASKVVEGKERALSSSSSSSAGSEHTKNELNTSLKLDESYLQSSQVQADLDETDSPLNRLESVAVESPLEEQAKMDELTLNQGAQRPLSTNFDDLPATTVLPSGAQRDKLKLASAIPRKSPKSKQKTNQEETPVTENPPERPRNAEHAAPYQGAVSASTENLAIEIDYSKKEKRKSHFNFFPKGMFGKKKKHKKSMENLLAPEEMNPAHAKDVPLEKERGGERDSADVEEGVVPLDMHASLDVVRISADSGVDTHVVNGVSSDASDSAPSSTLASPVISHAMEDSNENISAAKDLEDGPRDESLNWAQRPVMEWDVRQVGLWLIRMGMEEYSKAFQEKNIDGQELLGLNGARLKDLGVLNGNHRDLIKRKIKEFKANSDGKQRDSKKEGKSKDKFSKKIFWKGKYTVNE
ncbi:uncharacterized protein LOC135681397 isoform X2 [Rhopilema esculentum]|uniref:uncharacterized protein LOC135681397 isoform X2 n=1 Tax=Rhopilema esculentum TaxID=499914 RepID=UPI0031D18920